jgi:hypothetical protein
MKLKIPFFDYLGRRLGIPGPDIPNLATLVSPTPSSPLAGNLPRLPMVQGLALHLARPAGHAESCWQAETEALEQDRLGAIGAHDAAH